MAIALTTGSTICLTVYGILENGDCCESSYCKGFLPNEGLDSNTSQEFKAFPNPAKDKLTLDFYDFNNTAVSTKISVHDALGVEIYSNSTSDYTHEIDIKNWIPGVYFCRVENDGIFSVKKIIKN